MVSGRGAGTFKGRRSSAAALWHAPRPEELSSSALDRGGLRNAGTALQSMAGERVPVEVSLMLQGAILLFAIGAEIFVRNRLRIVRAAVATP